MDTRQQCVTCYDLGEVPGVGQGGVQVPAEGVVQELHGWRVALPLNGRRVLAAPVEGLYLGPLILSRGGGLGPRVRQCQYEVCTQRSGGGQMINVRCPPLIFLSTSSLFSSITETVARLPTDPRPEVTFFTQPPHARSYRLVQGSACRCSVNIFR